MRAERRFKRRAIVAAMMVAISSIYPQPASFGAPERERIIAEFTVNTVRKGEAFLYLVKGGDFLVSRKDLSAMGVSVKEGRSESINGEEFVYLSSVQGLQFAYAEKTGVMTLTLNPELLGRQKIDFGGGRGRVRSTEVTKPQSVSGFVNYAVAATQTNTGAPLALQMTMELGVATRGAVITSSFNHVSSNNEKNGVRLMTSVTFDRPGTQERVIAGDFNSPAGGLGRSFNMGGLSYSRVFQMAPGMIRQPTANVSGSVTSPSEVDVYLDGVRIRSERVAPGVFDLSNLNYYGGSRDIEVVVRDRFGREQRFSYNHYFTENLLAEGLHEWSYNLGFVRENFGTENNDYGRAIASAFHRFGYSDNLTLGWHLNAIRGEGRNVGGEFASKLGKYGVLAFQGAASEDPQGNRGHGYSWSHSYQRREFSTRLSAQQFSSGYHEVGSPPVTSLAALLPGLGLNAGPVVSQWNAGLGYGNQALGSVGINYTHTRRQFSVTPREVATLTYSRSLGSGFTLFLTGSAVKDAASRSGHEVYMGVSWSGKDGLSASSYRQKNVNSGATDVMQVTQNAPLGEGLGYRVVSERSAPGPNGGGGEALTPSLQYNGPYGIYTLEHNQRHTRGLGTLETTTLGVAGSLVYADGHAGFSRPVNDAFAIVSVPDMPGVRVYANSQEIGKTDARGMIIIPRLGSYIETQISVSDKDVPMTYSMGEVIKYVTPAFRTGLLLSYDIQSIKAVGGTLVRIGPAVNSDGKPLPPGPDGQVILAKYPIESAEVRLTPKDGGEPVVFGTARGGEFFVENLKPASYRGEIRFGKSFCRFDLDVKPFESVMADVGEIVCK